jgi:hypothetical protein
VHIPKISAFCSETSHTESTPWDRAIMDPKISNCLCLPVTQLKLLISAQSFYIAFSDLFSVTCGVLFFLFLFLPFCQKNIWGNFEQMHLFFKCSFFVAKSLLDWRN